MSTESTFSAQPEPTGTGGGQSGTPQDKRPPTPPDGSAGSAGSGKPAREADPAAGRDLPDENGEPPSTRQPGNPDASEPPVENF